MAITAPVAGAVARGLGNVTATAPAFSAGDGVIVFTGEHYGTDTITAPASPWVELSANSNTHQLRAFALYSTTGAEAMPTFNWGASNRGWTFAAVIQGVDPGFATGATPGDRQVNSTTSIFGPAATKTPSVDGCIAILFGAKNKTTTSNGATFSVPSGFTSFLSDVPNGSSECAVEAAYQIQTTATTIPANLGLTGSIADGAVQTSAGCIFIIKPDPSNALAGGAAAATSASATLTTNNLAGSATTAASGTGALTTAIRVAGAAAAAVTVGAALTNWTTVTLAAPLYTGPGGVLDPNFWTGPLPGVGTVLSYDATKITIYTNAEISSTTNDCSAVVQFFDGTTEQVGIVVITPQLVSYASVVVVAAASLVTVIKLAGVATAVASSTGNLTTAVKLATAALSVATAAGALATGIQLNLDAFTSTAATGMLTGGQASLQGSASVLTQAIGQLTAKIQLAGQVAVNSVVAGALATNVVLTGAASSLTNAAADIQTAILLSGNVNVVSSAAGAALLTTSFAGGANAVTTAIGNLLIGLRVAGDALIGSEALGNLSTGISLEGAADVDTAARLQATGPEGTYGASTITVLSSTGFPVVRATFIEGSAAIVSISFINIQGLPFIPTNVRWRVDDVVSDQMLVDWTPVSVPSTTNAVTVLSSQNRFVSLTRLSEQHQILFEITDGLGTVSLDQAFFDIVRRSGLQ